MAHMNVEEEIAASAEAVWKLLSDFGGLKAWATMVESCELDGEGVGAVRTLSMGGMMLKERLERLDEAAKSFSYSIVEGPIPANNYLATVSVSEIGQGRSRIIFSTDFEPVGVPEADLVQLFEGVYSDMAKGVQKAPGAP